MSDERRDEVLRRLLTGDDVPEAERSALEGDAELDELETLVRRLDRAGARERERLIAEAQAVEGAPGESRTAEVIEGAAGSDAPRWLAAAAAVLLAVLGTAWFAGLGGPAGTGGPGSSGIPDLPDNVMLSAEGDLGDLRIEGSSVSWEHRDPPVRARYELRFWDAVSDAPLHRERNVYETTWTIPPKMLETWPTRVVWEVHASTSAGAELGFARAESRLSR